MLQNTTKAKLKAGETVIGCFVRYPEPSLIELLALQGWDFLVLDGEHGTMGLRDLENMVRACEIRDVTPIVRVSTNLQPIILRFMDTGAQGAQVPWINSGADAEAAVRSVKYFPEGARGMAGVRAADFAQTLPQDEYAKKANAETMVICQIESPEAVENASDIASVKGVDAVFIGPSDFSQSHGYTGQPKHPKMQEAMQRVTDDVAKSDAVFGTMINNTDDIPLWRERGARYIATTIEPLLKAAAQGYLQRARELV